LSAEAKVSDMETAGPPLYAVVITEAIETTGRRSRNRARKEVSKVQEQCPRKARSLPATAAAIAFGIPAN
jgi:hypothetical protein